MCADFDRRRQPREPHFTPLTPHAREQRDIGQPGGGAGRREYVGGSGVYPASLGPERTPDDAVARPPGLWGHYREYYREEPPPENLILDNAGNLMRPPAPTGPLPVPWDAPYNRPLVYDRQNYEYARSNPQPLGEHYGPVQWGTMGDRDRTRMNPDRIDMRGAMPGADYSRTRALGEKGGPSFAGRGPRGWRRSDERIREDVNEALTMHPAIDARDLKVDVRDGVVTLRGTVDDRTSKRLAVDVAESVAGVADVHSEIRVQRPEERDRIDEARDRREDEVARR